MLIGRVDLDRLRRAAGTEWVRAVAILWVAQVVSEIAFSFALPFIPLYLQDLGVRDVTEAGLWAGAMAGVFAIAMAGLAPVWGAVADRYGRKLMIQRALFGGCVVIGAMSLVQTPEQLFVLRVIQGGLTGVVAATAVVVSLTAPRAYLASALGLMQAAMFLGASLGPVIGGAFSDRFGFRAAFVATGALFLVTGLLVTFFVREPRREPVDAARPAQPVEGGSGRFLGRGLLAIVALMAIVKFAQTAPQPVLPLFVQQLAATAPANGYPGLATLVGVVVAATGIAATFSAVAAGRLADRYGRRTTLLTCLGFAAAISVPHALIGSVAQLLVLRTAMGLALGGMTPALQALLTEMTPPGRRGAAFGWLATANAIGNGTGPVVGSLVAAGFGIPAVFLTAIPAFLGGAWLLSRAGLPTGSVPTRSPPAPAARP